MKTIITGIMILGLFNVSLAGEKLDQYFTFMGFTLEESEMSDVLAKLGDSDIHKEGDASASYTGVCYHSPENNVTIIFESGEMGGGTTVLCWKVVKNFESKFPCREIKGLSKESLKIGDMSIDADLDSSINLLPKNISTRDDLAFNYNIKIPFTKKQIEEMKVEDRAYAFWDQNVTIQLYAKDNKLTGYSVYKVTSW